MMRAKPPFSRRAALWAVLTVGAAALAHPAALYAQTVGRGGAYAPADIQYGLRIYGTQCTVCHGAKGNSIAGVDLLNGQFRRVSSDADLRAIITAGIPGTAMPPFKFDAAELTGVIAYVRNMRDFDARAVTVGDPARGRAVFEASGNCTNCHRVNGKGPRVSPDLSDIGALRTADALERALLDPASSPVPTNRSIRAVSRTGQVITGRRVNEDSYTVQLIDSQERLVSLTKADLREYTVIKTPAMPSYRDALTAENVADVVAYLLSLKGVK